MAFSEKNENTYLLKREMLMKEKTWLISLRMKKEGT